MCTQSVASRKGGGGGGAASGLLFAISEPKAYITYIRNVEGSDPAGVCHSAAASSSRVAYCEASCTYFVELRFEGYVFSGTRNDPLGSRCDGQSHGHVFNLRFPVPEMPPHPRTYIIGIYVLFLSRFASMSRTTRSGGEVESYYMGELNLCLGAQDSVLSGRSITKALNTASNQMLKNLLILNSPGIVYFRETGVASGA